jgi:hypothetical protein
MMKYILYLFSFLIFAFAANAQTQSAPASQKLAHKANIAGKPGGTISKNALVNSRGIVPPDKTHHISEFKMTIINRENDETEFFNDKSGGLTENMCEELKAAQSGNKVIFENIKCVGPDSTTHFVNSLSFTLK